VIEARPRGSTSADQSGRSRWAACTCACQCLCSTCARARASACIWADLPSRSLDEDPLVHARARRLRHAINTPRSILNSTTRADGRARRARRARPLSTPGARALISSCAAAAHQPSCLGATTPASFLHCRALVQCYLATQCLAAPPLARAGAAQSSRSCNGSECICVCELRTKAELGRLEALLAKIWLVPPGSL